MGHHKHYRNSITIASKAIDELHQCIIKCQTLIIIIMSPPCPTAGQRNPYTFPTFHDFGGLQPSTPVGVIGVKLISRHRIVGLPKGRRRFLKTARCKICLLKAKLKQGGSSWTL